MESQVENGVRATFLIHLLNWHSEHFRNNVGDSIINEGHVRTSLARVQVAGFHLS